MSKNSSAKPQASKSSGTKATAKAAGTKGPAGKKAGTGRLGERSAVAKPIKRSTVSNLLWLGIPAAVAIAIVAVAALSGRGDDSTSGEIEGVREFSSLSRNHTADTVDYPQTPPVGGDHDPQWAACDGRVYDDAVRNENAVHSLEHGAVWISYQPGLDDSELDSLRDKVEGAPYTMMSPVADQSDPLMMTAWGAQLTVDGADDPRIDQFLAQYRQGPQTPEPGASCSVAG